MSCLQMAHARRRAYMHTSMLQSMRGMHSSPTVPAVERDLVGMMPERWLHRPYGRQGVMHKLAGEAAQLSRRSAFLLSAMIDGCFFPLQ